MTQDFIPEPFRFMRKMGLEPTRCNHHKILSLARLPVPTLPLTYKLLFISKYDNIT